MQRVHYCVMLDSELKCLLYHLQAELGISKSDLINYMLWSSLSHGQVISALQDLKNNAQKPVQGTESTQLQAELVY